MTGRFRPRFAVAAAAVATGWTATWSWGGLVEQPFRYVGAGLVAAVLIAVVGAGVRMRTERWYLALLAQLVVLTLWFQHREHTSSVLGGWVPTPGGLSRLADLVRAGASQVNKYPAPVEQVHAQAPVYLLAVSILLILGVDLIAAGLRRAPWAGLPLIVALTVPISVLDSGLPALVFVATGVMFAVLLATVEADRLVSWGQVVTGRRARDDDPDQILEGASVAAPALKIALTTAVAALVLPVLVPMGAGALDQHGDKGPGPGSGTVSLTNPLADLKRDLVRNDHLPLLDVVTDASRPTYVRLSVLDTFNGTEWVPSARQLDSANLADGDLPVPAGISAQTPGEESTWNLSTASTFDTTWLPTPYVTRRISIERGDWRYNTSTMDIASADQNPPKGVVYSLTALTPEFDPTALDRASQAQLDIQGPMTQVPGLIDQVAEIAKQVTAAGQTDYAKAVLLQDWFRTEGGFTYSLAQGSGNGMPQLLRFITVDKVGYCEQYAAAMAVMARTLGIPARVVVGLLSPHKVGPDTYHYTTDDLHAWPEIYFRGSGWVRFEPTPSARTGAAPAWTTGGVPTRPSATPTVVPTQNRPTAVPTPRRVVPQTSTPTTSSSTSLPLVLVGLAVLVLLLLVPVLVRRAQRRRRLQTDGSALRAASGLWDELRATAVDLGLAWPEGRSVRMIAASLIRWVQPAQTEAAALERLAGLVERARYSREFVLEDAEHDEARATLETWSALLTGAVRPGQVRLARVLPRSILRRVRTEVLEPELSAVR